MMQECNINEREGSRVHGEINFVLKGSHTKIKRVVVHEKERLIK